MQIGTPIFDRFACYGYNLSYTNYQLTYSDSYSGLLNSALPIISDFPYAISMLATFDSLLMDNYHAYMLTLELYTVAIYCLPNGRCKIFYSHGRDLLGKLWDPFATCTSIEIDSLMNLVQHFQNICAQTSVTYEIKMC